mmetsp:Transcript_17238/g.21239  ORF Transcript_17238/g.21239 Transcript_17238/m.21239 type:complete len:84 (+) Transcript_17238:317-568(+)
MVRKIPANVLYWSVLFTVPAAAVYFGVGATSMPEDELQKKLRRDHVSASVAAKNNKELSSLLKVAMKDGKGEIQDENMKKRYE